jgi:hypothetical protein
MHLDIRVSDADLAEQELLALGALRVPRRTRDRLPGLRRPSRAPLLHRLRPHRYRMTSHDSLTKHIEPPICTVHQLGSSAGWTAHNWVI